jgi:hypothetical protein
MIGSRQLDWPFREQWAKQRRTAYGDLLDCVRVSDELADFATAAEVETIIAQLRALYTEAGRARALRAAKQSGPSLAQQPGETTSAHFYRTRPKPSAVSSTR